MLRPADAGGEVLRFHCVGDDDEMGCGPGGFFFSGTENKIAQLVLKISKRRAVNRVDDDRNTRALCSEPSKDSRFAAVGMNDVGLLLAENGFEFLQRAPVMDWVNGTDQLGHERKRFRYFGKLGFE